MSTISTATDLRSRSDEAQASLGPSSFAFTRLQDGEVVSEEEISIPGEYYDAATAAVVERLTLARNKVIRTVPKTWAQTYTELLLKDGVIRQEDTHHVETMLFAAFTKAIDELAVETRDVLQSRLPLTLRSLIPLIARRRRS